MLSFRYFKGMEFATPVELLRRPRPHGAVLAWIKGQPDGALPLSAVTVGELQAEIEKLRERDHGKASEIETWLQRIIPSFDILAMDAACFRVCATLVHRNFGAPPAEGSF